MHSLSNDYHISFAFSQSFQKHFADLGRTLLGIVEYKTHSLNKKE